MDDRADRRPGSGKPPFRRLVEVQAAHAAGDALVAIALANTLFFSVPIGQARERVGLYLLLTMTPFALLSPVVGPLLDRWRGSYRIGVLLAASGRAILALLMASRTDRLVLYPMAFGMLVLSRTHGVSRCALVPDTLHRDRSLMASNAVLAVTSALAGAVAAGPGVGLQRWLGTGATLRAAAALFVAGAVAAVGLPQPEGARRREVVAGAHRLLSPRLLAGGIAAAASRGAVGFLLFFLAFSLRSRAEGARGFALVLGAAAAGSIAGSLVAPVLRLILRESLLLLASLGAMGATSFVVAPRFDLRGAAVVAGVSGLCSAAARLGFDSLIQQHAPEEVRGRTFARYETIFQLCWVGGAGAATAIHLGPELGLRAVAAICGTGIVLALRGALRRRDVPSET